ncbi:MAG: hypothetical protein O3C10_12665, partial [Chloroflexi bacterium]|nr:hypothetical protein [Chloroflexota bacterium]
MAQQRFRRPTVDDFDFADDVSPADRELYVRAQKPILVEDEPPPMTSDVPQTGGEFFSQATRSLNPVDMYLGSRALMSDPGGAASAVASTPIRLAQEGVDEFRQGNYARAARKGFEATLPIAGGVAGAGAGLVLGGP